MVSAETPPVVLAAVGRAGCGRSDALLGRRVWLGAEVLGAGSGLPPKYWSSTRWNTGSPGAANAPVTATAYDTTGHRLATAQLGMMERVNLSPLRVSYWA